MTVTINTGKEIPEETKVKIISLAEGDAWEHSNLEGEIGIFKRNNRLDIKEHGEVILLYGFTVETIPIPIP